MGEPPVALRDGRSVAPKAGVVAVLRVTIVWRSMAERPPCAARRAESPIVGRKRVMVGVRGTRGTVAPVGPGAQFVGFTVYVPRWKNR